MTKTLGGRRINALTSALEDAVYFIIRDTRNVIECGTNDNDLATASKETRAAIEQNNELLRRLHLVLTGKADPAGLCRFCRCMEASACELPSGEPCAWLTENVCTNPGCVRALRREQGKPRGRH
jgi:hypothetical protein